MLVLILSGLLLAILGPMLHRLREGLVIGTFLVFSAGAFVWFVQMVGPVSSGRTSFASFPWVAALGVEFSFYLDGLSLFFALLTTGVGVLVLLYSIAYLRGNPYRDRFFGYIFLFMISMLGIVLAADLITLVIFWEMTTLTSYLLIGFEHEHEKPRQWALQALLVTGAGGLALLAAVLLIGQIAGSRDLLDLLASGEALRSDPLYLPVLLLVVFAAFTKSAQFPFHFWLPSAMIAPTPVSAFLHSAAMVKAGIYLLARLLPVLGGTAAWHWTVGLGGAVTMVAGALLALGQKDMKRLLAYATVSVLGILTLMLGLGTETAVKAAMAYLLIHALYKAALFMVAGAVDKGAGTREIPALGGLWRAMPWTALIGVLAAISMAGLPPAIGYLGKSLFYEAQIHGLLTPPWLPALGALANSLLIAAALIFAVDVFFGRRKEKPAPASVPILLVASPFPLALAGLLFGIFPDLIDKPLLTPAAAAVRALASPVELKLWHGINPVFLVGIGSILFGLLVYGAHRKLPWRLAPLPSWGPDRAYHLVLHGLDRLAHAGVQRIRQGRARISLALALAIAIVLAAAGWTSGVPVFRIEEVRLYEIIPPLLALAGAALVATADSILTAVLGLGTVGYAIAFIYLLFGAPDLAMTQFGVETLAVLLFVLVLYRLPHGARFSRPSSRFRDALLSLLAGGVVGSLLLMTLAHPPPSRISDWFLENSVPAAHGHNVVNTILVDFRSLDTLGEITVLATAAIGIFLLLGAGGREKR